MAVSQHLGRKGLRQHQSSLACINRTCQARTPPSRRLCHVTYALLSDQLRRKARSAADGTAVPAMTTNLRLFIDTASTTQLELWLSTGMFHGFTCNPIILQRDGVKCTLKTLTQLARAGLDLGCKEVHLQAWGGSVAQMSSIAFDLAGIDPAHIVVKLPATLEGAQTAGLLRDSNVRVNMTGLYSPPQVLVAQAVGAEYAAAYLGRMNDAYGGEEGTKQVVEMQQIVSSCNSKMRLMVASVRDTAEMAKLASQGCNTFTISPTVAAKLFKTPFTIDAAGEFEAAARDNGGAEDGSGEESSKRDAAGQSPASGLDLNLQLLRESALAAANGGPLSAKPMFNLPNLGGQKQKDGAQ